MQLISRQKMLFCDWRSFEHYPKQNADIVLHIKGYHIRNNKNSHDFIRIPKFDGMTFNPKRYTPNMKSVVWTYSWLPVSRLVI